MNGPQMRVDDAKVCVRGAARRDYGVNSSSELIRNGVGQSVLIRLGSDDNKDGSTVISVN